MARSSPRTLSLELPDSPDPDPGPDPARQLEEEPGQPPCEIPAPAMDPEAECSVDIIVVASGEKSATPSPEPCRDLIAYEVKVNRRDIEELCICCGSFQVHTLHPLFMGGMCCPCKDKFRDYFFMYDEDGYQSYCCICCAGQTLLMCENPDCTRCYCFECVDALMGPGTSEKVQAVKNWLCFLCRPPSRKGLLRSRETWREQLKAFYDQDSENPMEMYKTVPVGERKPVRVLSLFGDIRKELTSLGFLENGAGWARLKYLEDVTDVVRRSVEEWGPFDLVVGCTPPLRPAPGRTPGWYVFQYQRILEYARPPPSSSQPFFWMFVDNLILAEADIPVATRFLETRHVTILDYSGKAIRNAVHVWSNIPAVRSRHSAEVTWEELSLLAQDKQRARALAAAGLASLVKKCFFPLREYFKYFQPN